MNLRTGGRGWWRPCCAPHSSAGPPSRCSCLRSSRRCRWRLTLVRTPRPIHHKQTRVRIFPDGHFRISWQMSSGWLEVGLLWARGWTLVDQGLGPCGPDVGPLWTRGWVLMYRKLGLCEPKAILQYTTVLERASFHGRLFKWGQRVRNEPSYFEVFYLYLFQVSGNVPDQGSNRFLQIHKLLLFSVELFVHCL